MTSKPKSPHAVAWGRKGGQARTAAMTPEARRAAAAHAGKKAPGWPKGKPRGPRTNWGKGIPFGSVPLAQDPPVDRPWAAWFTEAQAAMARHYGVKDVPKALYKARYLQGHTPEDGVRLMVEG